MTDIRLRRHFVLYVSHTTQHFQLGYFVPAGNHYDQVSANWKCDPGDLTQMRELMVKCHRAYTMMLRGTMPPLLWAWESWRTFPFLSMHYTAIRLNPFWGPECLDLLSFFHGYGELPNPDAVVKAHHPAEFLSQHLSKVLGYGHPNPAVYSRVHMDSAPNGGAPPVA